MVGIIDRNKKGWYAAKRIISLEEINTIRYDMVIVMIYDKDESEEVVKQLYMDHGIPFDKILIGREIYF